jgi:DNA polymerase I-like protein with 3'-5' exonuclease and polymerase domains
MLPALQLKGEYPYDVHKEVEDIWVIDDPDELDDVFDELARFKEAQVPVALDTETDDVNPKKESPAGKGEIVTTQIAWIEDALWMEEEHLVKKIERGEVEVTMVWIDCRDPRMLEKLKVWVEDEDAPKVLQGGKFDQHVFANHGIFLKGVVGDNLGMSHLQYPERMSHSLDGAQGLVATILQEKRLTTLQALGVNKIGVKGQMLKKTEYLSMGRYVEDEEMRPYQQVYSCFDVLDTIRLYYIIKQRLQEMEWNDDERGLYGFWEDKLCRYTTEILYGKERQGVCIDEEVLEYLLTAYENLKDRLTEEIYDLIGVPINLNSYQQKAWLLYGDGTREFNRSQKKGDTFELDGWGLPCQEVLENHDNPWEKKRKRDGSWTSGFPSTDKDHLLWTLERTEDEDTQNLIELMAQRQEVTKLLSATLEPIKRNLRERHITGVREPDELNRLRYVHGTFSVKARTGRLACVAAWTPVVTARGSVAIKDVVVGDLVWTHRERWRRVTHQWIKGTEDMFSVYFDDGNILTCTKSHRLLDSQGRWVTVREILRNGIQSEVGQRPGESTTNSEAIQGSSSVHDTTDCGEDGDPLRECARVYYCMYSAGGTGCAGEGEVFSIENGRQEPHEGEDGQEAPRLEGEVRRSEGVPHHFVEGEASICASCCDDEASGPRQTPEGLGGASHRQQSQEQQGTQSCSVHEERTPRYTFPGKQRACAQVTRIERAGSLEVYDITVDEDHSYLACGVYSHNSALPNLQQIPSRTKLGKVIRHAFICEPGEVMLVADYSQLELNILGWYLASLFGDTSYAELLRNGDIHQHTADALDIPRFAGKTINFGIIYGMSKYKLARELRCSVEEAEQKLLEYGETYPAIDQYNDWAIKYAKKHGTARTLMGRYRQLPNINDCFRHGRWAGRPTGAARQDERRARNTPIQGSAQDIVAEAQQVLFDDEELKSYGFRMIMVVHDEIIAVCKAEHREAALARMVYLMENAVTFPEYDGLVKFPVEGHWGLDWGECKNGKQFACPACPSGEESNVSTGGRIFVPTAGGKCALCGGDGDITLQHAQKIFEEAA